MIPFTELWPPCFHDVGPWILLGCGDVWTRQLDQGERLVSRRKEASLNVGPGEPPWLLDTARGPLGVSSGRTGGRHGMYRRVKGSHEHRAQEQG